jgi:threonine dehydrogenase-like Zn-dependent dehydrogenase
LGISVKPGQFVIGSFAASDTTCPNRQAGYQSSCVNREWMLRVQAHCQQKRQQRRWSGAGLGSRGVELDSIAKLAIFRAENAL